MPSPIAFQLAKKAGIAIPEDGPPAKNLQYTTLETLMPGQDYRRGIMYYTVPSFLHTTKKQGKGKDAPEVPVIETYTSCMTSEGEVFEFDEVNLYEKNYAFPKMFVSPPQDSWGGDIVRRFSRGETKRPDVGRLYARVRKVYETYIEFADEMYYDIMTLWVLGSYLYKVFESYPYLHFNGTKDSGKSQNLRILKTIGFNTHWSGEMTAADMYRHIAGNPGVICIDEAEVWKGERAEALRSILRGGYNRGMEVSRQRQNPNGRWEQERFPIYSPKALASINPLDDTTRSRTIVVRMRPALRVIPLFKGDTSKWASLRDDLHLWGLGYASDVAQCYEDWHKKHEEVLPELNNRAWEISASLISLMDFIWGTEEARRVGIWLDQYFTAERKATDSTDITRLIALALPGYISSAMAHDDWYYPVVGVLDHMKEYLDEDAQKSLSTRFIAKQLQPLGFIKQGLAKGGKTVQILEADLRRVFSERRIEPMTGDVGWLAGQRDYQTEDKVIAEDKGFDL